MLMGIGALLIGLAESPPVLLTGMSPNTPELVVLSVFED